MAPACAPATGWRGIWKPGRCNHDDPSRICNEVERCLERCLLQPRERLRPRDAAGAASQDDDSRSQDVRSIAPRGSDSTRGARKERRSRMAVRHLWNALAEHPMGLLRNLGISQTPDPNRRPNAMKPYFQSGDCTLYHGDCLELLPTLSGIDAVITDPPYGQKETHDSHLSSVILRNGEPAGQVLRFAGISCDECVSLASSWTEKADRWVVFTCEWKFMHALDRAGLLVRFGIWRKPDGAPQFTGDRPGTGWEAVAICHRKGRKRWNGGGKHAFWDFSKAENKSGHPTGKPLGLFANFVKDFTDIGDIVLDPYMGSGTTGIACIRTGRKFIGIEIDESYCETAAKRIERELAQGVFAF